MSSVQYVTFKLGLNSIFICTLLLFFVVPGSFAKPKFKNCQELKPSVMENSPIGTPVIQVVAVDTNNATDVPLDVVKKFVNRLNKYGLVVPIITETVDAVHPAKAARNIVYTIVRNDKFTIDNTGWIKTNFVFDHDRPNNHKEAQVIVKASVASQSEFLTDFCVLTVTIEDINDNLPQFEKAYYEESIPKDFRPGREAMRISAVDIDDGANSIVVYSLHPSRASDEGYFKINSSTGIINLVKSIENDEEKKVNYVFHLIAEAANPGDDRSTTADVKIKVVNAEKQKPEFIKFPEEPIQVYEDVSMDKPITNVSVKADRNGEFPVLSINPLEGEDTICKAQDLGNGTYAIKLVRNLDYEKEESHDCRMKIENKDGLSQIKDFIIKVLDVNDHSPIFLNEDLSSGIEENIPPGAYVMTAYATDADKTEAYSHVTYSLDPSSEDSKYFEIDPESGRITTLKSFDREEQERYQITVIATDGINNATLSYYIHITDVNDNPPHFTQSVYEAKIDENVNTNTKVIQVTATDLDTDAEIIYFISDGNEEDKFFMDKNTGVITVKNVLDYETKRDYNLEVIAFDGIFNDTAVIHIIVKNVNDNAPKIADFVNIIVIDEETIYPDCILEVQVFDRDSPPEDLTFSVDENFVSVDQDGCIRVDQKLDRDPPNGKEFWNFTISATDNGNPPLSSSPRFVYLRLRNINDNKPFLTVTNTTWKRNINPGIITTLTARDYDEEIGSTFTYALDSTASPEIKSYFRISGDKLYANRLLGRESKDSYDLPIAITDNGEPPLTAVDRFTVFVIGEDEKDEKIQPGYWEDCVYYYHVCTRYLVFLKYKCYVILQYLKQLCRLCYDYTVRSHF